MQRPVENKSFTRQKITAFALSILVFPLLVLVAFHSSSSIVVSTSPLFHFANKGQNGNLGLSQPSPGVENVSLSNGSLISPNSFNPNASFNLPNIPESLVVGIIVVLFIVVAFSIVRNLRASNKLLLGFNADDELKERAEVAQVLDDTVSKLKAGGEYRETVLECYRLISGILEKKSTVAGRTLTAREFKEIVSSRLALDTPYLSQATELFELARYSEKEITEKEAAVAIESLSNLSKIIKG
ncbi:MAG: DUF4129 domain-containing protein [Nitrososphaerales archaeon]